jgi:hypothetical protein
MRVKELLHEIRFFDSSRFMGPAERVRPCVGEFLIHWMYGMSSQVGDALTVPPENAVIGGDAHCARIVAPLLATRPGAALS